MKTREPTQLRFHALFLLALSLAFAALPAKTQDKPGRLGLQKTEGGIPYLSTGVGYDSRVNLPGFSTRLIFSTRNQKYLADIDIEISPVPRGKLIRINSPGPWLEIDLPPGKYRLRAKTGKGQWAAKSFEVFKDKTVRVKVVWDISDEDI
jgi:hypothetical protein